MASMIDSLPPEETAPQISPWKLSFASGWAFAISAPSMLAVIDTISASNFMALGQMSTCRGFDCELIA